MAVTLARQAALTKSPADLARLRAETWTMSPAHFEEHLAKTQALTVTRGDLCLPMLLHRHERSDGTFLVPCNEQCLWLEAAGDVEVWGSGL